jgi:hypothetical protein
MLTTGYAYSWDITDDQSFATRLAALAVDRVAIATSYHSARAGTPWQRGRTAMAAGTAALYRPVRERVWRNRRHLDRPRGQRRRGDPVADRW